MRMSARHFRSMVRGRACELLRTLVVVGEEGELLRADHAAHRLELRRVVSLPQDDRRRTPTSSTTARRMPRVLFTVHL
ncbi:hypothetical protein UK23_04625 [Lentzea aerocolonigenes]|uniref:Uncharacterized protein n=1 Tax=Lentzea aerocolonigenes TaxID=68170 RepID=A0A0F0HEG2_LENAE|nr:hypothetical protein UK23_04625 [Lentzea aerocolonigenes]